MTPDKSQSKVHVIVAFAAAAVFVILNAATLGNKSLWIDEMRTGYAALAYARGEALRYILLNDPAAPLYNLLMGLFSNVAGLSDVALRVPSLVFMAACILLFARFTRRFLNPAAATLAVLLFVLCPNTSYYAQEAHAYALFLLLSLIAYGLCLDVLKGRRGAAWFGVVCLAGLYAHVLFAFVLANCVLYALLRKSRRNDTDYLAQMRKRKMSLIAAGASAFLLYLPWLYLLLTRAADPGRTPDVSNSLLNTLTALIAGLLTGNAYAGLKIAGPAAGAGLVLWIFGLFAIKKESSRRAGIIVLWTFAPALLFLAAFSLFHKIYDFFHYRYLLHLMPLMLMAVAAGMVSLFSTHVAPLLGDAEERTRALRTKWMNATSPGYALLLLFCLAYPAGMAAAMIAYYPAQHQDWRAAENHIAAHVQKNDVVVAQGIAWSSIDYYNITRERDFRFAPTNRISETAEMFSSRHRKWFVYYRDHWNTEWFRHSQEMLDLLAMESKTFPGLYGDVVVGFSSDYTLVNGLNISFENDEMKTRVRMPDHDIKKDSQLVKIFGAEKQPCDRKSRDCTIRFFNIKAGDIDVAVKGKGSFSVYGGNGKTIFEDDASPGTVTTLKLQRGAYEIKYRFANKDKDIVLLELDRVSRLKLEDEGTGPEYGHWFLDWIRK